MPKRTKELSMLSQVFKNTESANAFCKYNNIKPNSVVVLWWEECEKYEKKESED